MAKVDISELTVPYVTVGKCLFFRSLVDGSIEYAVIDESDKVDMSDSRNYAEYLRIGTEIELDDVEAIVSAISGILSGMMRTRRLLLKYALPRGLGISAKLPE